jgi:transcriptional regulator with XRE-family HTH domain
VQEGREVVAERGAIGAWAYSARGDAGLSVEEVASRLHERGVAVSPATLRGIEGGSKKPGRALLNALSELYGVHPPKMNGTVLDGDLASLVEATARQATASERVAELLEEILGALTSMGPPQVPPEVQREVAEAEADLAARLGSETQRQSSPPAGREG